jgi:hypothetical protein
MRYGPSTARQSREPQVSNSVDTSWGPVTQDRTASGSSSQSQRTASLTSIIDGYRYSPLGFQAVRHGSLSDSFYYDYSEDFEYVQEPFIPPSDPPAPIPTRASSTHRTALLEEQNGRRISENQGRRRTTVSSELRQQAQELPPLLNERLGIPAAPSASNGATLLVDYGTQAHIPPCPWRISSSPSGEEMRLDTVSSYGQNGILSLELRNRVREIPLPIGCGNLLLSTKEVSATSKSPERQVEIQSPGKTTIKSVQASILGLEDQQSDRTYSLSTIVDKDDERNVEGPRTLSRNDAGSSPVDEPDSRHQKSISKSVVNEHGVTFADTTYHSTTLNVFNKQTGLSFPSRRVALDGELELENGQPLTQYPVESPAGTSKADTSDYNHNEAAMPDDVNVSLRQGQIRLSSNLTKKTDETLPLVRLPPVRIDTPLLAPKPISPAKELRLKNSVPQLMKALPPLPGDIDSSDLSIVNHSEDEISTPAECSDSRPARKSEPLTVDLEEYLEQMHEASMAPYKSPKFKVRLNNSISGSNTTLESRPWNKDKYYPWMSKTPDIKLSSLGRIPSHRRLGRSRLRLKEWKNETVGDKWGESGTVKRTCGIPKSKEATGFSQPPRDLFAAVDGDARMFPQPPSPISTHEGAETPCLESLASASCQMDITPKDSRPPLGGQHGNSLDIQSEMDLRPSIFIPATTSEAGTFKSAKSHPNRRKVLRQKLSNLRRRGDRSPSKQNVFLESTEEQIQLSVALTANTSVDAAGDVMTRKRMTEATMPTLVLGDRLRSKLSRWMKEAKHVVNVVVGKRPRSAAHDRADQAL